MKSNLANTLTKSGASQSDYFVAPYWQGYQSLLQQLFSTVGMDAALPDCDALNRVLAGRITEQSGKLVRFVPAEQLPAIAYEEHIFSTGEISTRQDNWHDVFNALAWGRFPCIKAAMNARHHGEIQQGRSTDRGPVRDALTLFDECGVIVVGDDEQALRALAQRDWNQLFCERRPAWQANLRVFILGHALLEKFLNPYKALTAQVLIFRSRPEFLQQEDSTQAGQLDRILATRISSGQTLCSSAELSPLPLMGIPGWWQDEVQDEAFYADRKVFRAPPPGFIPAAVHPLEDQS